MKGIFDLATINRCRKMWTCRLVTMEIIDKAFSKIRAKREGDSAYRIQRILRGHMDRNGK